MREEREEANTIGRLAGTGLRCFICGEYIGFEEPFYWDDKICVHIDCAKKETEEA